MLYEVITGDAYDRLEDKETESKGIIDDNIIDNDKSTENVDKLEEEHKEAPITTGEEAEMGSLEWIEKKIEENRDYIESEEDIKDFKQIFSKIVITSYSIHYTKLYDYL